MHISHKLQNYKFSYWFWSTAIFCYFDIIEKIFKPLWTRTTITFSSCCSSVTRLLESPVFFSDFPIISSARGTFFFDVVSCQPSGLTSRSELSSLGVVLSSCRFGILPVSRGSRPLLPHTTREHTASFLFMTSLIDSLSRILRIGWLRSISMAMRMLLSCLLATNLISRPIGRWKLRRERRWLILLESSFWRLRLKMLSMLRRPSPLFLLRSSRKCRADLELLARRTRDRAQQQPFASHKRTRRVLDAADKMMIHIFEILEIPDNY